MMWAPPTPGIIWTGENTEEVQRAAGQKFTETPTWNLWEPRFEVIDGKATLDGKPVQVGQALVFVDE